MRCLSFLFLLEICALASGAPVKIFSTGVDDQGNLLPFESEDLHWRISFTTDPTNSDKTFANYNVAWAPNTPTAQWILPKPKFFEADPLTEGSTTGVYVYQTTFDLTGFDTNTVELAGSWQSDNQTLKVTLNGQEISPVPSGNFPVLEPFYINSGFVQGVNVLEFTVLALFPVIDATGLIVDFTTARGCPNATAAPYIDQHPVSKTVDVGGFVSFDVRVECGFPSFQWRKNRVNIPNQTGSSLHFVIVKMDDAGEYDCVVSENGRSVESLPATLVVQNPEARLSILLEPSDTKRVFLKGVPFRTYGIEFKSDLSDSLWSELLEMTLTSDQAEEVPDPQINSESRRFYRAIAK